MKDPVYYINSYFQYLNDVKEHDPDIAFARVCEDIAVFGVIEDLREVANIHVQYKINQFNRERMRYDQSNAAI